MNVHHYTQSKQDLSSQSLVTLDYNGSVIRIDDEKLNLTDMWRAAGGPENREPYNWARFEGAAFIEAVAMNLNLSETQVLISKRGKNGGTSAHWQIGLAYAKYLSPEFHMWCNTVVRDRMENKPAQQDLSDPATLRHLLLEHTEREIELQTKISDMSPKVDGFDRIAHADGSMCITDAAKALQMRPKDLFAYLDQNGWTYKRTGSSHRVGYQTKTTQGLLEHKTTTVLQADGTERIKEQVRVTPKGLTKLAIIFGISGQGAAE